MGGPPEGSTHLSQPAAHSTGPWAARIAGVTLVGLVVGGAYAAYVLVDAMLVESPTPSAITASDNSGQHQVKSFVSQVDGRSAFYTPDPPPPPRAPDPVVRDEGPREPPKPTSYGGPKIVATINDAVWFDNGKRVAVGKDEGGVTVVEIRAPWEVVVLWKEVEFRVPLFDRDKLIYPESDRGSTLSEQIEPAKPSTESEGGTGAEPGKDQSTATQPITSGETEETQ